MDDNVQYTAEAPEFLHGKDVVQDGNRLILDHVAGDIVHLDKIIHSYPIDWRTKQPVMIRASQQWFINTEKLKQKAIESLADVEFYPKSSAEFSRKSLERNIQNRPDWCISRQRVWGTPIPVFYSKKTGEIVHNEKLVNHLCSLTNAEGNIDFWWAKENDELLPREILAELNMKIDDVERGKVS